jgi:hypothetical protein
MTRVLLLLAALAMAGTAAAQGWVKRPRADLQLLDKITARITRVTAEVGKPVEYGTLSILVGSCNARPAGEVPDSAAWLEVTDSRRPGETMFRGWMFASAPAVSMMEHPVYDLRVLDCK